MDQLQIKVELSVHFPLIFAHIELRATLKCRNCEQLVVSIKYVTDFIMESLTTLKVNKLMLQID